MKKRIADFQRCGPGAEAGILSILMLSLLDIGFRAVLFYRLAHACRCRRLTVLAGIFDRMNLQMNHCSISSMASIGPEFGIANIGNIVIGGKAVIGANCDIRQNTTFGRNAGKRREDDPEWTQPRLGDNVRVDCHGVILGPVRVTDGTMIGASALVISDIDVAGSYGGVPARRVS
jgi:serine O-acetyltransferase